MADITISVSLPDAAVAREPPEALERRLRLLWALDEIRAGRLSRVGAARWLAIGLDELLALADAHGLPAFDYEAEDFKAELASIA